MKDRLLIFAIAFASALVGANVQPILTGAGKLIFPENATPAYLQASSGALTITAGGSNQNVNLTPSGTGTVNSATSVDIPNNRIYRTYDSGGTVRSMLWMDATNPDVVTLQNNQRNSGGPLKINTQAAGGQSIYVDASGNVKIGSGTPSFTLDAGGDINTSGVFRKGGTAGAGSGSSVTVCSTVSAGACTSSCTLIFNGGIRTGGTCP